jgi:hypothetical protein
MKTVALRRLGGLGNQMHRYAYAAALCEQNGWMLKTERWVGEKIFTLGFDGPGTFAPYPEPDGTEDIVIDGYRQTQGDLIYTRRDCRRWFKLRPEVEAATARIQPQMPHVHLRRGDYASAGYPLISEKAAETALAEHGFGAEAYVVVSDDGGSPELRMVDDFVRLMRAPVLFRGNSTYSWWAACLGHGRVFSPIITGLAGGVEHDNVRYTEGNHNACADLPGIVSDLHLPE